MRPLVAPSIRSQCHDDEFLSNFLSNDDFRKLYNKTEGNVKRFQNKTASIWFIKQCIVENSIPATFLIKNKPQNQGNTGIKKSWNEVSKEASINHMKAAIIELRSGWEYLVTYFEPRDPLVFFCI